MNWRDASFTIIAIIALLSLKRSAQLLSDFSIGLVLIALFWYASKEVAAPIIFASQALIALFIAGYAIPLSSWRLAGVTYDTYLHLAAAFISTLIVTNLLERKGFLKIDFKKRAIKKESAKKSSSQSRRIRESEEPGLSKASFVISGAVVILLGVGVEVVEWASLLLLKHPLTRAYVLDTIKDLLNDALGIIAALIAQYSR